MQFTWNKIADGWRLDAPARAADAAPVTVRHDGTFWQVYVGSAPLMPGNWTSEIGAKSDAWQHVIRHALEYYGTRLPRLVTP